MKYNTEYYNYTLAVGVRCGQELNGKWTCYAIVATKLNRAAARDYCRTYTPGADLVSIESAEERDFVAHSLGG